MILIYASKITLFLETIVILTYCDKKRSKNSMCALYQKSTKYVDCIGTNIIYLWCWHIDHDHQPPRIYPLSCFHNKLVSYPCIHLVSIGPRTCIFGIHYNHTSLKYKSFLFSSYLFFQLFCEFKSSWINKQLHSLLLTNHKILIVVH
jgi:hypothetical protein